MSDVKKKESQVVSLEDANKIAKRQLDLLMATTRKLDTERLAVQKGIDNKELTETGSLKRFMQTVKAVTDQVSYAHEKAKLLKAEQRITGKNGDTSVLDHESKQVQELLQGIEHTVKRMDVARQSTLANYERETGGKMPRKIGDFLIHSREAIQVMQYALAHPKEVAAQLRAEFTVEGKHTQSKPLNKVPDTELVATTRTGRKEMQRRGIDVPMFRQDNLGTPGLSGSIPGQSIKPVSR